MKLFFSWQSDIPEVKTYIRKVLQKICNDLKIEYDEDSRDEDNAEYILNNIMLKIDHSQIVVGDLTSVGTNNDAEKIPNPNVMFEVGYAEARVSRKNLILVICTDFGTLEDLPFDLNKRSAPSFSLEDEESKKSFEARIKKALSKIVAAPSTQDPLLNKYEKTILFWCHSKGNSISVNSRSVKIGDTFETSSSYFHEQYDDTELGRFTHAVMSLLKKDLLTTVKDYRGDDRFVLTLEGEEISKNIDIEDVSSLIQKAD